MVIFLSTALMRSSNLASSLGERPFLICDIICTSQALSEEEREGEGEGAHVEELVKLESRAVARGGSEDALELRRAHLLTTAITTIREKREKRRRMTREGRTCW